MSRLKKHDESQNYRYYINHYYINYYHINYFYINDYYINNYDNNYYYIIYNVTSIILITRVYISLHTLL